MKLGPSGYEYVNAMVRAQVGRLLKIQDYEAILGCSRPEDLAKVLRDTPYGESITTWPRDFSDMMEEFTLTVGRSVDTFLHASPEFVRPLLEGYMLMLESRSIVNTIRSEMGDESTLAEAGIIPLGVIKRSTLKGRPEACWDRNFERIIQEVKEEAAMHKCAAPLFRLIKYCGRIAVNVVAEAPAGEQSSMLRLIESLIGAVDVEILLKGTLCGMSFSDIRGWLSNYGGLEEVESRYGGDIEYMLGQLRGRRYGNCLSKRPGNQVEHILERFPYCILLHEAHSAMSGYPFRASTVAAGISLKLVEARNLRLAIMGASGRIDRRLAFKLMVTVE
ncbi:MAG: V-type ATPase subunit [Candidatus Bathyarchaeia archaeon]